MEPLQHGLYYHIYNRGNNREDLFRTTDNYRHFLFLYEKYIYPIADTFAWVLMKNHFHLLIRIKEVEEILPSDLEDSSGLMNHKSFDKIHTSIRDTDSEKRIPNPTRQFSHLFNAYAQAYNKVYNRTGTLFERPFHRKIITSDPHFRNMVIYIHTNPVHHGFTDNFKDYPWSSYGSIISAKPTKLSREKVIGWFDDKANFIETHNMKQNIEDIWDLLLE